jgi:hypothetical protein
MLLFPGNDDIYKGIVALNSVTVRSQWIHSGDTCVTPKIMTIKKESRPQPNSIGRNEPARLKKANWAISHRSLGTS